MNINKIRKNIGNIQRKTAMKKTISKTKQVSNILRHQITQKTAEQQIATHATKDNIEASNYHQFAIQPLNTSKPLSKDEIIECQALKHFFTLKDDNGEYKSIPIELVLETKDEIENAYKKQVPNMELPSVDYSLKHSPLIMVYNWNNFGITYFPANVPLKPEDVLKTVLLYIKDEKLKIDVNKILKSSNDEQKALLYNCYIYYTLAHEYKHFDQFSLITKVFGAETPNALGELNGYLKTKQKLTNNSEEKKELYEKLDKVEDNNERLNIIKNSIKNGTIDLIGSEKKAILSYQKNCDKTNNKEITDEEKIMAQKYVDGSIGYSWDDLDIYYNSSLEQEAYGYQIQKSLELFNKIKQSDLEHKNLKSFKEDIQKKIEEKEKKIEEKEKKIEEKEKKREEEINAQLNILKNKKIEHSQIMINNILSCMNLKPNSSEAKEILKELDKKLNFNQLIKDIATSLQVEPNFSEAKEILKELNKILNSSQFKEILEKYELKLDLSKLEK